MPRGRKRNPDVILAPWPSSPKKTHRPPKRARVSEAQEYATLLRTAQNYPGLSSGFARVSTSSWVLQGYSRSSHGQFDGLHSGEYVHIEEIPLLFKGQNAPTIKRVCDCGDMAPTRAALRGFDPQKTTAVEAMAPGLPLGLECLHVEAFEALGATLKNLVPAGDSGATIVHHDPSAGDFIVACGGAVLGTNAHGHVACKDGGCSRRAFGCEHVREYSAWLDRTGNVFREPFSLYPFRPDDFLLPTRDSLARRPSISRRRVSLTMGVPRASFLPIRIRMLQRALYEDMSPICGVPDASGTCASCGEAWDPDDPVTRAWITCERGTLYGHEMSCSFSVYYRPCTKCDAKKIYDGWEDGVFNYSNRTLFLHEVVKKYMHDLPEGRATMYGFHASMSRAYAETGSSLCSRETLTHALESFMDLVDIDYEAAFQCPVCSTLPWAQRIVVMDGKALGFRRDLMRTRETRETVGEFETINTAELAFLRRTKDGFGPLLRAYASGTMVDHTEHARLRRLARKHIPILADAVPLLVTLPCPPQHRKFLTSLATEYPVTALVWARSVPRLRRILETSCMTESDRAFLAYRWPALFDLVAGSAWTCLPRPVAALVGLVLDLANVPSGIDPESDDTPADSMDSLEFMPALPACRPLKYRARISRTGAGCKKKVRKSKNLTPGMFGLFCPHGICLGFTAMSEYEGTGTAFDILYRRFPEPPGMVVYDNACHLSQTCLKYAAAHFALTVFLIDRLHWADHVACNEGYCMDTYPKDLPVLGGNTTLGAINSQVAEQCNSKLEFIRTSTAFMNETNYVKYTKLFLALCNLEKMKKM